MAKTIFRILIVILIITASITVFAEDQLTVTGKILDDMVYVKIRSIPEDIASKKIVIDGGDLNFDNKDTMYDDPIYSGGIYYEDVDNDNKYELIDDRAQLLVREVDLGLLALFNDNETGNHTITVKVYLKEQEDPEEHTLQLSLDKGSKLGKFAIIGIVFLLIIIIIGAFLIVLKKRENF